MNRPKQEGGAGTARIIPDVLRFKHEDGRPMTVTRCLHQSALCGLEVKQLSAERENLLCNFDGDPIEAQMIRDIDADTVQAGYKQDYWEGLAQVIKAAQAVKHGR